MEKLVKTLRQIVEDIENDVKELDGKPFNGRTVGEHFGYQGAAIASLAKIIISVLENNFFVEVNDGKTV